ncbi:GL22416 [Drosophila persimilis]|nr:GL22416 [Drosophila persimilis]
MLGQVMEKQQPGQAGDQIPKEEEPEPELKQEAVPAKKSQKRKRSAKTTKSEPEPVNVPNEEQVVSTNNAKRRK